MDKYNEIKLEILQASYIEHFKMEKDLAYFLPLDHPKRIVLQEYTNDISRQIKNLKDLIDNKL